MILSLLYEVTRKLLSVPSVLLRSEAAKDAELLVLRHENAVLRRQLAGQVRYEPADRFWFAVLSRLLDRRRWQGVFPVTPGTLLDRHRRFIAGRWDHTARRRTGRPPTPTAIRAVVLRLAEENPRWGHRRIQGEPARLGHRIAPSTVWQILRAAGVDPAPRRAGPTWREFLTVQAESIIAADFLHLDTVLGKRLHALAFLEHHTRRPHITGVTAHPTREWTTQQARNLAADLGERMESPRFLLRDRDGKYGQTFDTVFQADDLLLILGEAHARQVLKTYEGHYNRHRPHQARDQLPPQGPAAPRRDRRPRHPQTATLPDPGRLHQRVQTCRLTSSDDFSSGTGCGLSGGVVDLVGVGEALSGQCLAAEQAPPGFLEVEPAGSDGDERVFDAGVVEQPFAGGLAVVAGEVVGDHVDVADRVCLFRHLQEPLVVEAVAR
nr:integrase [Saccharothrix sp. ALI-22-I]